MGGGGGGSGGQAGRQAAHLTADETLFGTKGLVLNTTLTLPTHRSMKKTNQGGMPLRNIKRCALGSQSALLISISDVISISDFDTALAFGDIP